jgi:acetyl-CoA carboxylase biotin carboxyl carrier protein
MADGAHDWSGLTETLERRDAANKSLSYDLSYADALSILRLIDNTPNVRELRLTLNGLKIEVMRESEDVSPRQNGSRRAPKTDASSASVGPVPATVPAPALTASQSTPVAVTDEAVPSGAKTVRSPIAGIFYRSPSPAAPAFVEQGESVDEDTVVCIIEVMKVMNNIKAGMKGVIKEICVPNEELVQFDQALLVISPTE